MMKVKEYCVHNPPTHTEIIITEDEVKINELPLEPRCLYLRLK
jgi:hypothetical protein